MVLLAMDVGNTNTTLGIFRGEDLISNFRLTTNTQRTVDELGLWLRQLLHWAHISLDEVEGIIVGSVVPSLDSALAQAISRYLHIKPLFVGPGIRSGMPLRVETPQELGADRLCNAVAAYAEYGGPVVVVDFGTATTWDVVSAKGEFLGGVIAPGLEIAAEALFTRTAKLPRVELEVPKYVIGKATVDAMQIGLVWGYVGLIEGLTRRVLEELGGGQVVATGGLAPVIAKHVQLFSAVDNTLTLKGLRLLWTKNCPTKK